MKQPKYLCNDIACHWIGDLDDSHYVMTRPAFDHGGDNWGYEEGEFFCPQCGDEISEATQCLDCEEWFYEEGLLDGKCASCHVDETLNLPDKEK